MFLNIVLLAVSALALYLLYNFVLFPAYVYWYYKRRYGDKVEIHYLPLVGLFGYMRNAFAKYGDVCGELKACMQRKPDLWAHIFLSGWSAPRVMPTNPEIIRSLLQEHRDKYTKVGRHFLYATRIDMVLRSGKEHERQRRQLAPLFNYESLLLRVPAIVSVVEKVLAATPRGKSFNSIEFGKGIAGEVVVQTFFESRFDGWSLNGDSIALALAKLQDERGQVTVTRKFGLLAPILGNDYGGYEFLMNAKEREYKDRLEKITRKIYQVIADEKKAQADNPRAQKSAQQQQPGQSQELVTSILSHLVQLLLRGEVDSDEEIKDQFYMFLAAGTETTGITAAMCLYALARHPEWQKRLYDELVRVKGAPRAPLAHDKLRALTDMDAFISEVQRCYTPLPFNLPRVAQQAHDIGELHIRKGFISMPWLLAPMHNPKYYNAPSKFDPERWQRAADIDLRNASGNAAYNFLPFSAGARNCLGQYLAKIELKYILALVLEKCTIRLDRDEVPKITFKNFQCPQNEYIVIFEDRKTQ